MDTDVALVLALLLGVLALPTLVSAYADGRSPRLALVLLALGAGVGFHAWTNAPGDGYRLADIPNVVVNVIARLVN